MSFLASRPANNEEACANQHESHRNSLTHGERLGKDERPRKGRNRRAHRRAERNNEQSSPTGERHLRIQESDSVSRNVAERPKIQQQVRYRRQLDMFQVKVHREALVERRRKAKANAHDQRIYHFAVLHPKVRHERHGTEPARIRPEHRDILNRGRFSQIFHRIQEARHHKANGNDNSLCQDFLQDAKTHQGRKHRVQHHHRLHLRKVVPRHGNVITERGKSRAANAQPPEFIRNHALEKFPRLRSSARTLADRGHPRLFEDVPASKKKCRTDCKEKKEHS